LYLLCFYRGSVVTQEFAITRSLELDGVVQVLGLERFQDSSAILEEDFGGQSLDLIFPERMIDLSLFFSLAIRITTILGQIHDQGVMHKDINPSNIVWNPTSDQIKIIDFGIATRLDQEIPEAVHPNLLEGTLSYISPEQTGRMNRAVDFRADLYSLGATFFNLFLGIAPFEADNPMELVHHHLAVMPRSLHKVNPEIPEILSTIVLKLLSKDPENRYQSTSGLVDDLKKCELQWTAHGQVEAFPLGSRDMLRQFRVPQRLIGRESEKSVMLAVFERICGGKAEGLFFAGEAGVGKTALVRALQRPVITKNGYFASGKFDQFQRHMPYAGLTQALRQLTQQLLSESTERIATLKADILRALGSNGQVLINVIPELEALIGPQGKVQELSTKETADRFQFLLLEFVSALSTQDHPLVLFLDDLQWADRPTFQWLESVLSSGWELHNFLLVGAFRDGEIGELHPMTLEMGDMGRTGENITTIMLSPLKKNAITMFLADMFRQSPTHIGKLADLCLDKTNGNPFFLGHFLQSLHKNRMIKIRGSEWHWSLDEILNSESTANVIDLMMGKIHELPTKSQEVLRLAACLGGTFDLSTLSMLNHATQMETAQDLWPALQKGLILPIGQNYQLAEHMEEGSFSYRFVHDRIHQATDNLMSNLQRQEVHLVIGRILFNDIPNAELDDHIMDIVGHLNQGVRLILDAERKLELAQLNLQAGQKAKLSASYEMADTFFISALALLHERAWSEQYALAISLHLLGAETAYLVGDYSRMEKIIFTVLECASNSSDRSKAHEILMRAYYAQGRLNESIQTGLAAIRDLDPDLAQNLEEGTEIALAEFLSANLGDSNIAELVNLPVMVDEHHLKVMHILGEIPPLVYMTGDKGLIARIVQNMVALSMRFGNAPSSAIGYSICGILTSNSESADNINSAQEYGNLALELAKKPESRVYHSNALHHVGALVYPWKQHFTKTIPFLNSAFEAALEIGKYSAAAISASAALNRAYYAGENLEELEQRGVNFVKMIKRMKQDQILSIFSTTLQAVLNFQGKNADPSILIGTVIESGHLGLGYLERGHVHAFLLHIIHKLTLSFHFNKPISALQYALTAEQFKGGGIGNVALVLLNFYHSLVRLRLFNDATSNMRIRHLAQVEQNQQQLRMWSELCPVNFAHKYHLVEAELCRVLQNPGMAREHYDKAIRFAQENKFVNDEALACELAGQFYLAQGQTSLARCYLREAHYAYVRWGALAKVQDLEQRFPEYLARAIEHDHKRQSIHGTVSGRLSTTELLDLPSVVRASEVIFSEHDLGELLKKLMGLALENAGGQRGCLVLLDGEKLLLRVEGTIVPREVSLRNSLLKDYQDADSSSVSIEILHYVLNTKKSVVLNDATIDDRFASSPYIKVEKPLSVLCVPLVLQTQVVGAIYLENNLIAAAFTDKRVEMMRLLGTQAAISINNAQDLAARKSAEESAIMSKQRVRELSAHMERTREDEKKRIAAEVHDELGSLLTKLNMDFAWLKKHPPKSQGKLNEHIDEMSLVLSQISGTVRRISRSLRPKVLDEFGLTAALEWIVQEMGKRGNIKFRWERPPPEIELNDVCRTALFRICQEALSNVIKHADAREVVILLHQDKSTVFLEIMDDGKGIDIQQLNSKNSFGVGSMRERALQLNGQFGLERVQKGGTRLWVRIPILNNKLQEKT
jgi:predicted ATPase/signal transduction histidine kinase